MAFSINDLQDLKTLLRQHPEWRAELREIILTDELVALPRQFAEAQARSDARFERIELALEQLAQAQARTEARVEELAQAQARTEARVEELALAQARTEARMEELVQAQARTEARVEELAQAQARTEASVMRLDQAVAKLIEGQANLEVRVTKIEETLARLIEAQTRMEEAIRTLTQRLDAFGIRQDELVGDMLEARYVRRATSYFGKFLRRIRVVLPDRLDSSVEETFESRLNEQERDEIMALDILMRGRLRQRTEADVPDIWLAVEVSARVDRNDIERARQRAEILRKLDWKVVPVVAGQELTRGATDLLTDTPVLWVHDGLSVGWERALAAAMHSS